jgi:hypothetical protein
MTAAFSVGLRAIANAERRNSSMTLASIRPEVALRWILE